MQDDPLLFDYNVEQRVNDFVAAALAQVHLGLICYIFSSYLHSKKINAFYCVLQTSYLRQLLGYPVLHQGDRSTSQI
jgi:hypothetical protein